MHTKSSKKINEIAGFSKEKLLEMNKLCILADALDFLNQRDVTKLKSMIVEGPNNVKTIKKSQEYEEVLGLYFNLLNEGYEIIPFKQNNIKEKRTLLPSYQEADCVGCVCIKGRELTIAYRGTKNIYDIMHDLNISKRSVPNSELKGKVHAGFYSSFRDSLYSVQKILIEKGVLTKYSKVNPATANPNTDHNINITGFSLGGTVAQVAALYFHNLGVKNISVATFGSPRVFDKTLCKEYNDALGMKSIRVKNPSADPVPHLPTSLRFKHAGIELRPPVLSGTHNLFSYAENISIIPEGTFNINNIHLNMEESIRKELNHTLPTNFYTTMRTNMTNVERVQERLAKIKQDKTSDIPTELNSIKAKQISSEQGADLFS